MSQQKQRQYLLWETIKIFYLSTVCMLHVFDVAVVHALQVSQETGFVI